MRLAVWTVSPTHPEADNQGLMFADVHSIIAGVGGLHRCGAPTNLRAHHEAVLKIFGVEDRSYKLQKGYSDKRGSRKSRA